MVEREIFSKLGVNKNWGGSWPLDPPLVALLLEQAVDASFYRFYELTLPKQLNDLGVGSVELQSSLFSSHIWSDEIVICMRRIIILLFYFLMFFIIIQYIDNAFQKLYFLMQFLPICYRIHRSINLKYGGALTPLDPVLQKVGGPLTPLTPWFRRHCVIK